MAILFAIPDIRYTVFELKENFLRERILPSTGCLCDIIDTGRLQRSCRGFLKLKLKLINTSNEKTITSYSYSAMGRRAAGFIIFRKIHEQFEYLLLQTSYGTHHWTPPKGHVDPGESDIETAYRETKEEAGFEKDDLKVFKDFQKVLQYSVNGSPKTVIYWLAELHNNTPVVLSSEHQDHKWGNLKVACELSSYKDFQEVLHECEEYLLKNYKK